MSKLVFVFLWSALCVLVYEKIIYEYAIFLSSEISVIRSDPPQMFPPDVDLESPVCYMCLFNTELSGACSSQMWVCDFFIEPFCIDPIKTQQMTVT